MTYEDFINEIEVNNIDLEKVKQNIKEKRI
jgi:hypothetical protein